jgi:hypothetical protein
VSAAGTAPLATAAGFAGFGRLTTPPRTSLDENNRMGPARHTGLDLRGNPVGTRNPAALAAAEQALWRMMSFYGTPFDDLDAARDADPAWALPWLMHAGFLLSLTEPGVVATAQDLLARATPLLGVAPLREQAHGAALRCLLAGDRDGACERWEALLLDHPRDALALQWAHLFDFYRGDSVNLRQRVARVLPEWPVDDPLRPYVLGLFAFGLEENQLYDQAEDLGRRALAGSAKVPWAIHAVAHVMEMQGRHAEGDAWMTRWQGDWVTGNGFVGHLGFHHVLFAIEALDSATALARFDAHLRADAAQITLQRIDACAVLWRLRLLDVDVGTRWRDLVAAWPIADHEAGRSAFNDLHRLLALVGSGDLARATAWVDTVRAHARPQDATQAVLLPLMRGLIACERRDPALALTLIHPLRGHLQVLGGSHAQRDLIDQTLLHAAGLAAHRGIARALLHERQCAKPVTPLTEHWQRCLGIATFSLPRSEVGSTVAT